ncbi:YceI family protein [Winogradskyella schleiferi]|uniref:YceI family protein n=1 Tax=Winogradskyella schleiferi TaxID=2686078 RepID=UPI0015C131F3|nr:YceI family protein [Winogradskyella schleiferi]
MRQIIGLLLLLTGTIATSQNRYLTKTGELSFEASVPSFEEVAAKNESVTAILNTENGEFAALALVKAFRFKNALMEEHFNENYAESDSYPKAIFKGKINDFELSNLSETESEMTIDGSLTFHGVTKVLNSLPIILKIEEDNIIISGSFKVMVSDFEIEIPKIVKNKLSEEVAIVFNFKLIKK